MIAQYREQLQWVNERIEMVERQNRCTHDLNDAQRLSLRNAEINCWAATAAGHGWRRAGRVIAETIRVVIV